MVGFILTGHGRFANGLASAIEMVAGDQPAFGIVPFEASQAATFGEELRSVIAAMRDAHDGVVVFVDLLGGTPFNQAMMISQEIDNVEIVTGANLPMLIELLITRAPDTTVGELVDMALSVGREGICHKTIPAAPETDDFDEDEDEGGI